MTQAISVLAGLDGIMDSLEELYRDVHAHPELSLQEHGTAGLAAEHLRAANAVGQVGPTLDMLRPPAPATLAAIRRGPGGMPADAVTGADAQAVAAFVAAVTAH
jgi:metal-dependent amidase/aminoacylase/carboxypeptidase family protein